MKKKRKAVERPEETLEVLRHGEVAKVLPNAQPEQQDEVLHRVSVLISEADLRDMQAHFAEGKPGHPLVAVHPPQTRLTDAQREYRKAYRQRPEVREKMKAYRAARRKRLREAAKQQAAEQPSA